MFVSMGSQSASLESMAMWYSNTMIDYTAGHCGQRLSLSVGGFAAVSVVGRVGVMAQSWRTTQAITAQTKATIANQTKNRAIRGSIVASEMRVGSAPMSARNARIFRTISLSSVRDIRRKV